MNGSRREAPASRPRQGSETRHSRRKQDFIEQTLQLVSSAVGSSRVGLYFVDENLNLHDFTCWNVPVEFHLGWLREMHAFDPLHMRRLCGMQQTIARFEDAASRMPEQEANAYAQFMRAYGTMDILEMIFRHDGRVTAGLSVMWTARDPRPSSEHNNLAEHLQRYIEFNLTPFIAPARPNLGLRAMSDFQFTRREADVADLLTCGRTNAEIAECLGIGLATVKTHLLHIFEKAGVETRTGLVARLSGLS
jgi:DNA-binding CsgD family transcriptional regulator